MSELDAPLCRVRQHTPVLGCQARTGPCATTGRGHVAHPDGGSPRNGPLTEAEQRVLCCLKEGHTDSEIAQRLNLSARTVSNHVKRILDKLAARNRTQAVVQALRAGIIHLA